MKIFEKEMRKVKSKGEYRGNCTITINKKDKIDESKFIGDKCQVIVCYKEDFEKYTQSISEKDNTIKKLKDDLSAIHSDHQKELESIHDEYNEKIDELNKELSAKTSEIIEVKSEYEKQLHLLKIESNETIASEKLQHQKDLFEANDKFKNTLVSLRMKDHHETLKHIADLESLGFFEKHSSKFTNLIKEMKENDENKLKNIDEDFPKLQLESTIADNSRND